MTSYGRNVFAKRIKINLLQEEKWILAQQTQAQTFERWKRKKKAKQKKWNEKKRSDIWK